MIYLFLQLEIAAGDYEHYKESVHRIDSDTNVDEYIKKYILEYFDSKCEIDGDYYYFHNGTRVVSVNTYRFIDVDVYNILNDYI